MDEVELLKIKIKHLIIETDTYGLFNQVVNAIENENLNLEEIDSKFSQIAQQMESDICQINKVIFDDEQLQQIFVNFKSHPKKHVLGKLISELNYLNKNKIEILAELNNAYMHSVFVSLDIIDEIVKFCKRKNEVNYEV